MISTYTGSLVHETCITCGTVFGVTDDYHRQLKRSHKSFYCPNGHSQFYPGQSELEKVRDELTRERAEHDQTRASRDDQARRAKHQERRARVMKGHHTRLKRRVSAGCCPCCNRTFQNLARHMAGQHPTYVEVARG